MGRSPNSPHANIPHANSPHANSARPNRPPGEGLQYPRRKIRLLFAGTTYALGGAERILGHLVRGLNRAPFEVEVLALRRPGLIGEELRADGFTVHSDLTGAGRIDPFLVAKFRRFLLRGRFDVIYFLDHAHAVFYGALASAETPVRVRVMPVHTTGQWDGRPSIRRPIRLVRSRLTRIIAIAEAQRRYLVDQEGIPEEQLVVIRNGIPLEQPDAEQRARERQAVRDELGVADDIPVIGITAVLRPEKNHELLLAACSRLRETHPQAQLWIVGDGPRREFLEKEAARLALPGARFLGRREDARRVMAGFDVAVLSSHPRVETLPLSLIEAMDAGLPVVSTRVGALPELVEDGRSGLLVAPADDAALTQALGQLLSDGPRRRAMGIRGQAIAAERFSAETMVEATGRLLVELLARSG